MPIEIRELNIKINVAEPTTKPEASSESKGQDMKQLILDECNANIAEFLRKKEER